MVAISKIIPRRLGSGTNQVYPTKSKHLDLGVSSYLPSPKGANKVYDALRLKRHGINSEAPKGSPSRGRKKYPVCVIVGSCVPWTLYTWQPRISGRGGEPLA
jgi:hypothetical protein